jgi:hypothetical protein
LILDPCRAESSNAEPEGVVQKSLRASAGLIEADGKVFSGVEDAGW